jgi:hypothetical protein
MEFHVGCVCVRTACIMGTATEAGEYRIAGPGYRSADSSISPPTPMGEHREGA